MSYKPEYEKKTTVQDRAAKYAFGITAWSGEPMLAIQSAAISAYVEGYRDRRAEVYEVETTNGVRLINAERKRQIEVEGYSSEHDSAHTNGDLARAAIGYIAGTLGIEHAGEMFPMDWDYKPKSQLSDLVRAGALIAAEIDRLSEPQPEAEDYGMMGGDLKREA